MKPAARKLLEAHTLATTIAFDAIEAAWDASEDDCAALESALAAYNEAVSLASEFVSEQAVALRAAVDARSDAWQASDRGAEADDVASAWEAAAEEMSPIDEDDACDWEDVSDLDRSAASALESLAP